VFKQTPLDADEMVHMRGVLQFILERHEPYAAVVLDRYSNCLMGNPSSARLLGALVDPSLLSEGMNLLRAVFHPAGVRRSIANWTEVCRHLWGRAARELGEPGDETGARLLEELRGYIGEPPDPSPAGIPAPADLLLPVHFRIAGGEIRMFSTIMTIGTPRDVTLQELRIETFFPADPASEMHVRELIRRPLD
jgi:hypothetical protein